MENPMTNVTINSAIVAAKKTTAKVDAEIRRLTAENRASAKRSRATLNGFIVRMDEMNNRLWELLRELEPWRYSDSRFKRGCSWVWRGIKCWFNNVLEGCLYIFLACLLLLIVHGAAQAGGKIAGLF